jgi:hypothetical protein
MDPGLFFGAVWEDARGEWSIFGGRGGRIFPFQAPAPCMSFVYTPNGFDYIPAKAPADEPKGKE